MRRRHFLFLSLFSWLTLTAKETLPWVLGKYGKFRFKNVHQNVFIMHGVLSAPDSENQGFVINPAFVETKHGLVVVDPGGSYKAGKEILKQMQNVSKKPVIAIFNTHDHDDHWFANAVFKEAYPQAIIYAHEKMPSAAKELYGGDYAQRGFSFDVAKRVVFPEHLLKGDETLHIDGETFMILHPQAAHTNNDIAIIHQNSNTIFMGDLLMSKALANFGLHSSIRGNIRFLESIEKMPAFSLYVAGHGPSGSRENVFIPYLSYLRIIENAMIEAYKQELSRTDFASVEEKILQQLSWEELPFSHAFVNRYMHHIYSELEDAQF